MAKFCLHGWLIPDGNVAGHDIKNVFMLHVLDTLIKFNNINPFMSDILYQIFIFYVLNSSNTLVKLSFSLYCKFLPVNILMLL